MSWYALICRRKNTTKSSFASTSIAGFALAAAFISGCASMPGVHYARTPSVALAHPEDTALGERFGAASRSHDGNSGFRILTAGVDGFLTRVQMIDSAQKTLDLQYFIFRGDETGRLLTDALVRAADRGVRVRALVDDGDTVPGDEQIVALDAHPSVEVRVFNPFAYRGHMRAIRALEFFFNASRLDYRMHNKLLVVDNSVALVGGRNIGNQYFQMDPRSQFADDDVFSAGPIARRLSTTFDEYWNSRFAIPVKALPGSAIKTNDLARHRVAGRRRQEMRPLESPGLDYVAKIATGEPYAGMVSGRLPLVWAHAEVICDSPDKREVDSSVVAGRLMERAVAAAALDQVFMGSMNFDRRSRRLNTEIGLIIDSPDLALQSALRFEGMVQLENAYSVQLRDEYHLVWKTREDGKDVEYGREPARNERQRLEVKFLSHLSLGREL
jgi:putative cardiolipin synthase